MWVTRENQDLCPDPPTFNDPQHPPAGSISGSGIDHAESAAAKLAAAVLGKICGVNGVPPIETKQQLRAYLARRAKEAVADATATRVARKKTSRRDIDVRKKQNMAGLTTDIANLASRDGKDLESTLCEIRLVISDYNARSTTMTLSKPRRKRRREATNTDTNIGRLSKRQRFLRDLPPGSLKFESILDAPTLTADAEVEVVHHPSKSGRGAGICPDEDKDEDEDEDGVVAAKHGLQVLKDFAHARPHCAVYEFAASPTLHCDKCYCVICETPAGECSHAREPARKIIQKLRPRSRRIR